MIKSTCSLCGEFKKLDIHHVDGNHSNDVSDNRLALCSRCHHLAHVELNIQNTGRPGWKPVGIPVDVAPFPRLPWSEIKAQYQRCFPRA